MSTYDVPGASPSNNDVLAMGCWSEHNDGSLIFVESTEGSRVIYSMFDLSKDPPIEYRDAMPEASFKKTFSWDPKAKKGVKVQNEKWVWHDKTPFPWDRIIKAGTQDGGRFAAAEHLMTAAERVAESLRLSGAAVSRDIGHRADRAQKRVNTIWDKLSRAVGELRK
jgi:hypothetical protein